MDIVIKQLEVPKEMSEIVDALVGLVADIKAKKDISMIVAENLQPLMAAVEGFDKLGEEAKSEQSYNAYALLVSGLAKELLKKIEEPVVVAPVE